MRGSGKVLVDRAPDEAATVEDIAAVPGVDHRGIGFECQLGVDHEGCGLVGHLDQLGGVLREVAGFSDGRGHPFADVSDDPEGQGIAFDPGRIERICQRQRCGRQLVAGQHRVDAVEGQSRVGADRRDAGARMGA